MPRRYNQYNHQKTQTQADAITA